MLISNEDQYSNFSNPEGNTSQGITQGYLKTPNWMLPVNSV